CRCGMVKGYIRQCYAAALAGKQHVLIQTACQQLDAFEVYFGTVCNLHQVLLYCTGFTGEGSRAFRGNQPAACAVNGQIFVDRDGVVDDCVTGQGDGVGCGSGVDCVLQGCVPGAVNCCRDNQILPDCLAVYQPGNFRV